MPASPPSRSSNASAMVMRFSATSHLRGVAITGMAIEASGAFIGPSRHRYRLLFYRMRVNDPDTSGRSRKARPWIDQWDAGAGEVRQVSRRDRQIVRKAGRRNPGIPLALGLRDVQPRAAQRDCGVDR